MNGSADQGAGPAADTAPSLDRSLAESPSTATVPVAVQAALERLGSLDEAAVAGHVEVFDEVHRLLQDALATLDEA